MIYKRIIKPICDWLAALLLIVISMPCWLFIVPILIYVNNGKIIFKQTRIGKNNKPFVIYKFQTMNEAKDLSGILLPDVQRLHSFGNFLRKSSLDELPQLLNILQFEMSFIGPRPLLVEYLPLYSEIQRRRHEVMPGITGWSQINGRNTISWKQKFELDVHYVEKMSFCSI